MSRWKSLVFVSALALLNACNGDNDQDKTRSSATAVDGIITNAQITISPVRDGEKGAVIYQGTSDEQGSLGNFNLSKEGAPYLIEISATANSIDLQTGAYPVLDELKALVTRHDLLGNSADLFITPITSIVAELYLAEATDILKAVDDNRYIIYLSARTLQAYGYGLDLDFDSMDWPVKSEHSALAAERHAKGSLVSQPPILTSKLDEEELANVIHYRFAIEVLKTLISDANELVTLGEDLVDANRAFSLPLPLASGFYQGDIEDILELEAKEIGLKNSKLLNDGYQITVDVSPYFKANKTTLDSDNDGVPDNHDWCWSAPYDYPLKDVDNDGCLDDQYDNNVQCYFKNINIFLPLIDWLIYAADPDAYAVTLGTSGGLKGLSDFNYLSYDQKLLVGIFLRIASAYQDSTVGQVAYRITRNPEALFGSQSPSLNQAISANPLLAATATSASSIAADIYLSQFGLNTKKKVHYCPDNAYDY